jgi:transposase
MCARMDKPKAVTATAHKLARLIYLLITRGQEYVDKGQQHYEQCHRERLVRHLNKRAKDLGMTLVAIPQPVQTTPTKSTTYGEVS